MQVRGVVETVLDYLKGQLITWRLRPGQKLNEEELAGRLGISRPPLREAFRILTEQGLVLTIPRKGVYAADVSLKDLQELSVVRETLECCAIEILRARDQREFRLLEKAMTQKSPKIDFGEMDEEQRFSCLMYLTDFHLKLIEEADNRWLMVLYKRIAISLMRYQYLYFAKEGRYRESLKNHRRILAALRRGKYEDAKACIRSYVWISLQTLGQGMAEEISGDPQ